MNEIDKKTVCNVIVIGLGLFAATFLVTWQTMDWVPAAKASAGVVGGWLLGHLQRTGQVLPTIAGLKKEGSAP